MKYSLDLTNDAEEETRKAILTPLVAYNDSQVGSSQGQTLAITIKDDAGAILGGLWATTAYSWLFTQLLVVPEILRGQGIGTQLMNMAEQEAVHRGCTGAWLDTFEFQARPFYERLGYTCFAELPNFPPGYARFFLKKALLAQAR